MLVIQNMHCLKKYHFCEFGLNNTYSGKVHDIHKYNVKIIGSDSKPVYKTCILYDGFGRVLARQRFQQVASRWCPNGSVGLNKLSWVYATTYHGSKSLPFRMNRRAFPGGSSTIYCV